MNNEQKKFTLEDVRKMTLDEFRQLPQKQKDAFTEEQRAEIKNKIAREERIKSVDFINNESFKEFLDSNGYNIVGYDHNHYNFEKRYINFSHFGGYERAYRSTDESLILLGPESEWDKSMEDFTVKNIVENHYVKYLRWGLTEFKVYSIVNNSDAGGWGCDEPSYAARLEKDLSNEWIKYWALREEDYAKFILSKCAKVRAEAPEDIERYNNLLAKRIAELQSEHTQRIDGVNKKVEKYNQIEQIIKNVKSDLQV
ncbi:MAG: hypothetical protein ACLRFE_03855 [Clostridia bacterium]